MPREIRLTFFCTTIPGVTPVAERDAS